MLREAFKKKKTKKVDICQLRSEILVSAQGPLVLVLGLKGLEVRVWGQGLTTRNRKKQYHFFIFVQELQMK